MNWKEYSYSEKGSKIGLWISIIALIISIITFGYLSGLAYIPALLIISFLGIRYGEGHMEGNLLIIIIGFLLYPLIGYIIGKIVEKIKR